MKTEKKTLIHSHGSAGHFLFSKTDIGRLKEVKRKEIIEVDNAVRSAFPDMRSGSDFIDYANQQMDALDQFSRTAGGQ